MTQPLSLTIEVPFSEAGKRFDQIAAQMFPDYSRSSLQNWIREGDLRVDGVHRKPNTKLSGGEILKLETVIEDHEHWQAEDIPLNIVYEDKSILVIDKPVGLVVHPAAGNYNGTLLNGLLFYDAVHYELPRAGIVHRLDKDTSGLMVVAKTLAAQNSLVQQLQRRVVSRRYDAVVKGLPPEQGVVDAPIGRDPNARVKMAVVGESSGKEAITRYSSIQRFCHFAHMGLRLETGRTHQIRVHMAHLGHGLVGDQTYGHKLIQMSTLEPELQSHINMFGRQALHARRLGLTHPDTGKTMEWQSPLPEDIATLIEMIDEFDRG